MPLPFSDPGLLRALGLWLPIAVALLLWIWRRPNQPTRAAAALASLFNLATLPLVNALCIDRGWWSFDVEGGVFLGMPVDLLIGWIALWGIVPVLLLSEVPMAKLITALLVFDVVTMPLLAPIVILGPRWLVGEAMCLALCLAPGLVLARLTIERRRPDLRTALQAAAFGLLTLVLVPGYALQVLGEDFSIVLERPPWLLVVVVNLLAVPLTLGLAAACEFTRRGDGTPVPFDPPRRLVTSGPYAYVANPMQLAMTLSFIGWAFLFGIGWLGLGAIIAVVYSVGLARLDEGEDMELRFGFAWVRYRRHVRNWWPRMRPWHPSLPDDEWSLGTEPKAAILYVAEGCDPCSAVGSWLSDHNPVGLTITAAEDHPNRDLTRITYDPNDGSESEEGVAALARALEHVHLGWALGAFFLRLPGVTPIAQLVVDASGGGPRPVPRRNPK